MMQDRQVSVAMTTTITSSQMRTINRAAVLDLVRHTPLISRSQIARQLGLSLPTVMRIVDDFISEGLVRLHGYSESTMGRPRALLEFCGNDFVVIGIDLGGAQMFGAVSDLSGTVQTEMVVDYGTGPDEALSCLCAMIDELLQADRPQGQRVCGIGIGAPALTLSHDGILTWSPSLGWRDLPLKDILVERFNLPVFVENDVNLSALGELEFGAGQGVRNLVCVSVGSGIGAGIIIDGALYRGHNQIAGELGYLPPGVEFLRRKYERFGALESLASGTGIAARGRQILMDEQGTACPDLSAEDVFAAARRQEPWAVHLMRETVDYLSLAIAGVGALLAPEVIVLGGSVARAADLLIEPILANLDGVIPFVPRLVGSPLGFRAAAMGAIVLVLKTTTEHMVVKRGP
jgi:predicted NBD/HSP70 family sugar kinase